MDDRGLLRIAYSCIDNTTLEGNDNVESVRRLCRDSIAMQDGEREIGHVAAVCVYSVFAGVAKRMLGGSGIRVASVAGGFPSGQLPLRLKVEEVRYAVEEGADEVDVVISRGKLLEGNCGEVLREIREMREAAGGCRLKVILETGDFGSEDLIVKAAEIAIEGGADFIKTSTGKTRVNATPEAVGTMLKVVEKVYKNSGKMVGLKVAGGVRTVEDALIYSKMCYDFYGDEWFNSQYFRIGASGLVKNLFGYLTE